MGESGELGEITGKIRFLPYRRPAPWKVQKKQVRKSNPDLGTCLPCLLDRFSRHCLYLEVASMRVAWECHTLYLFPKIKITCIYIVPWHMLGLFPHPPSGVQSSSPVSVLSKVFCPLTSSNVNPVLQTTVYPSPVTESTAGVTDWLLGMLVLVSLAALQVYPVVNCENIAL